MQTTPNPIQQCLAHLKDSLAESLPQNFSDPNLDSFLDQLTTFQQLGLTQLLHERVNENPNDEASAAALLRSMSLLERTRARIARSKGNPAADQPERDEARHFLQSELAGGERPAQEVITLARSLGIAPATLKRAKASLNILSLQRARPDQSRCWVWSLPESSIEEPQGITGSSKMQIA